MLKLIIWIIVFGVVVIGSLAIFSSQSATAGTIKIGLIAPLTGDQAIYGISQSQAAQVAVDQINAGGGIGGKNLELVIEDGQCSAQAATAAAQKLITTDKVKIIIGGACAVETAAIAAVAQPAQVVVLTPSAIGLPAEATSNFIFRIYPDDALFGTIAANYANMELRVKKSVILAENNLASQALGSAYKKTLTDLGGQVIENLSFDTDTIDFSNQASKIKSDDPDEVYIAAQSTTSIIAAVKKLHATNPTTILGVSDAVLDSQLVSDNAKDLEGVVSVRALVDWVNNAKAKNLQDGYHAKFDGADPGPFAANTYDAVGLINDALVATLKDGMVDTGKITDWLHTVKNWPGALGPITINTDGAAVISENVEKIASGAIVDMGPYAP